MNEKEILLEVLTIIGYTDDKMHFVAQFLSLIYDEAIAEMTIELSEEKREAFGREIEAAADETVAKDVMSRYFSKEDFDQRLTRITQEQFSDYLETIYPTLSPEKQEKLTQYLSTLPKPE